MKMQYEQKIQRRCCRKLETDWKGQLKKGSPYQNGQSIEWWVFGAVLAIRENLVYARVSDVCLSRCFDFKWAYNMVRKGYGRCKVLQVEFHHKP